jgi:hypothetical protein
MTNAATPPAGPAAFDDLEQAYEALAVAIDQAGPQHEAVFLAKLSLVLAERLRSAADFEACIAVALCDLPQHR